MKNSIKFLPLLILYIFIVLMASSDSFQYDEGRYVLFTQNLSQGFYSDSSDMNLWNGPGYPIVLLPFALLKLPWLAAKLLNAIFLFGAVVYFYRALCFYIAKRPALCFSYLLGLYLPFLRYVHVLLTEVFAIFLISGFLFHFCRIYNDDGKNKWISIIAAAFYLGYLALTKVFFGYVILAMIAAALFLYVLKRSAKLKKTLLVCLFALIFCSPYLYYTQSLTGRVFYWANSGGSSLYWMSTPYDNELGDWHDYTRVANDPRLAKNHLDFLNNIAHLNYVEMDDAFKKKAIYNIKHYPVKFFKNWIANIGRMLFSYPFSYTPQKLSTFFYLIPNMFIVVLSFLCAYQGWRKRSQIPYEIGALLLFALITFGGSSLLSAYARQFAVIVPILALWMSFIMTRHYSILEL
ncbi:ArnT family glycosyltransferase [Candidatus Omnitrophota bacterium]